MTTPAKEIKPEDIIEILLRRRWWIILSFFLCIIVGIVLLFTLPTYYEAETLVLVQPQELPTNFVQDVVTTDITARLDAIKRQILSTPNLLKIINKFNMYSEPKYGLSFVEDKVADMRDKITIELMRRPNPFGGKAPIGTIYAFSIAFEGKKPEKVMNITNALATSFIDENMRIRERDAVGTSKFLEEELIPIREELEAKEKVLKEYREKNMGELPEQLATNMNMLIRIEEQIKAKEAQLTDAKNRLAMLKDQISQGSLLFNQGATVTSDGRIVSDIGGSITLDQARAMLSYLETRYTQKHPDIIRMKKIISELEKTKENNSISLSDEPQYIHPNAKMEVERNKVNINTLTEDIASLKSQKHVYEKRIEHTPAREQELKALKRDYNNIRASYDMLLNKKLEAEVSVNMERKQKGQNFQILYPAGLPEKPSFPNMKILFLLTIVAAPNIGFGLVFLLEYLDKSFRSPKDIESTVGFPVLASIPVIYDKTYKRRQRLNQVFGVVTIMLSFILLSAFAVLSFIGVDRTMAFLNQFMTT